MSEPSASGDKFELPTYNKGCLPFTKNCRKLIRLESNINATHLFRSFQRKISGSNGNI